MSEQGRKSEKHLIEHWQIIALILMIYDAVAVNMSYFLALWFRFDCQYGHIEPQYITAWARFAPIYAVACVAVFWFWKLYQTIWQFASYKEVIRTFIATVISCLFHTVFITVLFERMPISYYIVGPIFQVIGVSAVRFSYRFYLLSTEERHKGKQVGRVMLIGAGAAGQALLRDIHGAKEITDKVVCIIDDNPNKWNRMIDDVPVVGGRETILENVSKYEVDKKEDRYDNPVKSKAGKIIIVTLAFAMIAGSIFALVWAIVNRIIH